MPLKSTIRWLIFSMLLCLPTNRLQAQGITVPPGVQGYTVRVTNEFSEAKQGYVPITVSLTTNPARTATVDEVFTVSLLPDEYQPAIDPLSTTLILPAGASTAFTETIYVPVGSGQGFGSQNNLIIERGAGNQRFEYGRDLFRTAIYFNPSSQTAAPRMLLVSSAFLAINEPAFVCYGSNVIEAPTLATELALNARVPSLDQLIASLPDVITNLSGVVYSPTPLTAINNTKWLSGLRPSDIPEHWIGLSSLDQILISYADLKSLSNQDRFRRESLEKWVAAGGNLFVFDLPNSYQDAPKVLPLLLGEIRNEAVGKTDQMWREPTAKLLGVKRVIDVSGDYANYNSNYNYNNPQLATDSWVSLDEAELAAKSRWRERRVPANAVEFLADSKTQPAYLILEHGRGRIVGIDSDMVDWNMNQWRQLQNGIALAAFGPGRRQHIASSFEYPYGFTIPGVGEPPLIAFQVLLFLFIVLAGPVMFIVLHRAKQMTLVFLLVPLLSLTACLGLLGYAILVDGFDSWGRVQTVSWLDQQTGSILTESHAAYFHGTQPAPYSMSFDTMTFFNRERASDAITMRQTTQGLEFSGGDIRARTPHRATSLRSFETEGKLIFLPEKTANQESAASDDDQSDQESNGSAGSFLNRLGGEVLYAVALSENGLIAVRNMAEGERKPAKQTDATQLNIAISKLATELSPLFISGRGYSELVTYSMPAMSTAEDDDYFSSHTDLIDALRGGSASALLTEPNTYIAILNEFPDAMNQVEKINYKKQLHVIIGKW